MEFAVLLPPRQIVPYLCMMAATAIAVWTLICAHTEQPPPPWRWGDAPRGRGSSDGEILIHIVGFALAAAAGVAAAAL